MNKKLKILVSCYACSPKRGSEPGMGWSFVNGLSQHPVVHVIVEKEKWEKDILEELSKKPNENLKFYFIQKKRNLLLRKIWPPSYYWYYKVWQKNAYSLAQELDEKENFDLTHQLNMVGYREPGFLWKIKKPFVWGPIGGTENVPWKLFSLFDVSGKVFYGIRNIINSFQKTFLSRPRLAAIKKPATLIAATPDIQKSIQKLWGQDSVIITEVGTVDLPNITINKREKGKPIKIVWSGQHTPGKALPILLKSLALLKDEIKWELHVLGKGSETKKWKELTKELKIQEKCIWYGWIEKSVALNVMKNAHTLVITSLKDLTSTVIIEGISLGLPIISLDHCGFSFVVNDSCGIKIPINKPSEISINIKNAITEMYDDDNYRVKLSEGAIKRAQDFSWEGKIEKLNTVYKNILA
jgi:glycosyltransferase involved in cell wall biosynthesis